MSVVDRDHLLERLKETHSAIRAILKGVDLEMRVYIETGWRIRDILGHIATWDREVAKSLRAFLAGIDYAIPNVDGDESEFNEQTVAEQRELSTQQIVAEWEQARDDLKVALNEIPMDQFPGDLLYPWGDERGTIVRLVETMIEHDREHHEEIVKAVQASQEK